MKMKMLFILLIALAVLSFTLVQSGGQVSQPPESKFSLEEEKKFKEALFISMSCSIGVALQNSMTLQNGEEITDVYFSDQVMLETSFYTIYYSSKPPEESFESKFKAGVDAENVDKAVFGLFGKMIKDRSSLSGLAYYEDGKYYMDMSLGDNYLQNPDIELTDLENGDVRAVVDFDYSYSDEESGSFPVQLIVLYKINPESAVGYNIVEASLKAN